MAVSRQHSQNYLNLLIQRRKCLYSHFFKSTLQNSSLSTIKSQTLGTNGWNAYLTYQIESGHKVLPPSLLGFHTPPPILNSLNFAAPNIHTHTHTHKLYIVFEKLMYSQRSPLCHFPVTLWIRSMKYYRFIQSRVARSSPWASLTQFYLVYIRVGILICSYYSIFTTQP